MGGDVQVVHPNGGSFAFQMGPDLSVVEGGSGAVGKDLQTAVAEIAI
jgi:hypothetical protein